MYYSTNVVFRLITCMQVTVNTLIKHILDLIPCLRGPSAVSLNFARLFFSSACSVDLITLTDTAGAFLTFIYCCFRHACKQRSRC